uniref:Uncharacterized protein n=1 Tax=Plectus sambesii TaxID=2011161 RepID=A0A914UTS6_9BILA
MIVPTWRLLEGNNRKCSFIEHVALLIAHLARFHCHRQGGSPIPSSPAVRSSALTGRALPLRYCVVSSSATKLILRLIKPCDEQASSFGHAVLTLPFCDGSTLPAAAIVAAEAEGGRVRLRHFPFCWRYRPIKKMAVSVVEGCFLTGATIALIVYLLFLYTIAVNRNRQPFHSPFFALTFSLGVADVLQLLHTYVFLRFPSFGWLTDAVYLRLSLPVVNYASCAMWGIAFTQHVFVFVLAANRCSAIVFPHNHGQ